MLSEKYDKKAFEKFNHIGTSHTLGILYRDEQTITIIDCSRGDWEFVWGELNHLITKYNFVQLAYVSCYCYI